MSGTIFRRIGGRIIPIVNRAAGDIKNSKHAFANHAKTSQRVTSVSNKLHQQKRLAEKTMHYSRSSDFSNANPFIKKQLSETSKKSFDMASRKYANASNRLSKISEIPGKISSGRRGVGILLGAAVAGASLAYGIKKLVDKKKSRTGLK